MMDYLSSNWWQLWAAVSISFLILELTSGDLFLLSLAIGGAATAVVSLCDASFYVQLLVFAICSLLTILLVRPRLLHYLHRNKEERVSNADAIIGRTATVSQRIEAQGFGRVALDGDDWKAQATDSGSIEVGTKVRVVGRESIIITVEKL